MWRPIYTVHRMWVKFKFWFFMKQLAEANRTVIKYPKRHAECWWNCVVAKQIKFRQPQQSSINTVLRHLEMQMFPSGVSFLKYQSLVNNMFIFLKHTTKNNKCWRSKTVVLSTCSFWNALQWYEVKIEDCEKAGSYWEPSHDLSCHCSDH